MVIGCKLMKMGRNRDCVMTYVSKALALNWLGSSSVSDLDDVLLPRNLKRREEWEEL